MNPITDTFLLIAGAVAVGIVAANVTIGATVWAVGLCARFSLWMDGQALVADRTEREMEDRVHKSDKRQP